MKIDITKITNPIVRRALQERARDFMFNYADGSGENHTELYPRHNESSGKEDYTYNESRHTDDTEGTEYSERSSHTDETKREERHFDHTRMYQEHQEYGDMNF